MRIGRFSADIVGQVGQVGQSRNTAAADDLCYAFKFRLRKWFRSRKETQIAVSCFLVRILSGKKIDDLWIPDLAKTDSACIVQYSIGTERIREWEKI